MEESGSFPSVDDIDGLAGPDLDRALVAVERARRQVEATYLAVLDAAETAGRYRDDGHASVKGWAIALGGTAPLETHRRLQSMRAVRELPGTRAGLADGTLGVDQAREIAKLHANPRARSVIVEAEADLLRHATGRPFDEFSDVARRWHAFADPRGTERTARRAHEDRQAHVFERNGVVHLHARCGVAQGAAMLELFDRACEAEFIADWEAANSSPPDGGSERRAAGDGALSRTPLQRRMDALHAIFERAASTPTGAVRPEPLVNIVMTKAEYEASLAHGLGGAPPPAATADDIDTKRCETLQGLQVTPADAVMAAVQGHVRRVVVDSAGVVTDLGTRRRFVNGARDAVLLGGRRCLWPGCGRNSHTNQVDHTTEHARGGRTRPDNGGPACGRHNRWKSRGYRVVRGGDGVWRTYRPDGTDVTEPAAA